MQVLDIPHARDTQLVWEMKRLMPKLLLNGASIVCAPFHFRLWRYTWLTNPYIDLKYDNCGVPDNWLDQYNACVPDSSNLQDNPNGTCPDLQDPAPEGYNWSTSKTAQRYRRMRDALENANRTILYSLCDWGDADVNEWGAQTGNSWRMSGDIQRMIYVRSLRCKYILLNEEQQTGCGFLPSRTKTVSTWTMSISGAIQIQTCSRSGMVTLPWLRIEPISLCGR